MADRRSAARGRPGRDAVRTAAIGVELNLNLRYYWQNTPGLLYCAFSTGYTGSSSQGDFYFSSSPDARCPTLSQASTVILSPSANEAVTGIASSYVRHGLGVCVRFRIGGANKPNKYAHGLLMARLAMLPPARSFDR